MKRRDKRKVGTLVIKLRTWLHGSERHYQEASMLRNPKGKMCCLGFYFNALGVPADDLLKIGSPDELKFMLATSSKGYPKEAAWLIHKSASGKTVNSALTDGLIAANDYAGMTLPERMAMVKELFAKKKIKVKFV